MNGRTRMAARGDRWNEAVPTSATLVGVLFLVGFATMLLPGLRNFGIVPRTAPGLIGVVFAPLLHANAAHLLANAFPLFVLLVLLFADRRYRPWPTLAGIWIAAGLGTWLIGRGGTVHLGASSLIYGLATYLVAAGFVLRSWRAAFVAVLVAVLYGGLFYGVLPQNGPISWEGHLSGALAGVLMAQRRRR